MWQSVLEFMKDNKIYLLLSAFMALMPVMFFVVQNYFGNKLVTNSSEQNCKNGKRNIVRMVTHEYSQQNKDIENKIQRNLVFINLYRKEKDNSKNSLFVILC